MADDTTGGTGLQDAFGDVVEPPEIEMPPEWVGRGSPPRPDNVRNDIDSKTRQATDLRSRAQQLSEQEHRLDADVNVANQLLDARTDDYRDLEARGATLDARVAEVEKDVHRHDPDVDRALGRVNAIKASLGELPRSGDLMTPDGEMKSPPTVPVETDPAKIAVLRTQLTDAQAQLDKVVVARSGSEAELTTLKAEQAQLAPQLAEAKTALDTQTGRADELKTRAEALEKDSVDSLDKARGLETEAKNLTDALPDYQQIWDKWSAEHPDQAKVGEGELTLHVPARETAMAYAQGQREEAGRLEQSATDVEKAALDAANGADARTELAQRNEQQATELTSQATLATQRAEQLRAESAQGLERAGRLGDESDRLRKEAESLSAAGRTDAAATMKARADAMLNQSIALQTDSDHQGTQATQAVQASETYTQRSAQLTQDATKLRTEATQMRDTQTTMQQQAATLREDAASRDAVAKDLEDHLQSGQPFEYEVTDATGKETGIDVPAGPPPYSGTTDGGSVPATTPDATGTPDAVSSADAVVPTTGDAPSDGAPNTGDAPADPASDAAAAAGAPAGGDALLGEDVTGATMTAAPDATPDAAAAAAPDATETTTAAASDPVAAAVDVASPDLAADVTPDPGADAVQVTDFSAPEPDATAAPVDSDLDG
jgi:hypothetical protein